jgi:AcrR family transcriptional regulator
MGIEERKQSEKNALRNKILDAAGEIIIRDGYENLSIRKIALAIEYSPTVIYNYFEDKAAIVECLIKNCAEEILQALVQPQLDGADYIGVLRSGLSSYMNIMLNNSQLFKALIMNNIEGRKSGMLHKGTSDEKKTIGFVKQLIDAGIEKGTFRKDDSEMLTQIIWSSTFGLLSRMVLENQIDEERRQDLIKCHIDFIINGLLKK